MNSFKVGDKSKAICDHCKKVVDTTFQIKKTPIYDGTKTLVEKKILVGICDKCLKTVSIPYQSFKEISKK